MERSSNFRGGRGFGRGRGHGGRGGRGRGRGRGGGRGGRNNVGCQQRRHEEQGYTEDYVPLQEQHYGTMYPLQQPVYPSPLEYQSMYPLQQDAQRYQQYQLPQDQYQQFQFQQQGYTDEKKKGYTNGIPSRYMDTFETHSLLPIYQQQYQQTSPPPQYQQPIPLQYQDENSRYAANPSFSMMIPPPQPISSPYAEAVQVRQHSFVSVPLEEDVPGPVQASYQESNQPPPPSYHQQQQLQIPLPLVPQHTHGDWNYSSQQNQQWQQLPPQQQQFVNGPPAHVQQVMPLRDQLQYQRDQNSRYQDHRQDKHDWQLRKQLGAPPLSYVCHNCNQPGHWKQYCPLFAGQEDRLQKSFHTGTGPGQQRDLDTGAKSRDPRRCGGSQSDVTPAFAAKNEPRGQPPLPDGPVPPLPPNPQPYGNDAYAQPLPPQPDQRAWKCEPCEKSFVAASQYDAHMTTHVTCSDCDFSASKRVVSAHYETTHGQYSGQGLKEIEVEGQKFMVLVGNSAEDITRWREERRKKWFAMSRQPKLSMATAEVTRKRKLSIASEEDLEEGEIEEDEEAKAQNVITNATTNVAVPDSAALHHGRSGVQEPPVKKQRKTMLCKWFSRGRCRFSDAVCKYTVLSQQRDRSKKALKERATEQQWRGEQKSLLRKLLAKDVHVEQQKMLQVVHYLVKNEILRSTKYEEVFVSTEMPAVKIEVLKSDEMSLDMHTEANEAITSAFEDVVMEEVSDGEEFAKVVADGNVLPVVDPNACEQELPVPVMQNDSVPSQDGGNAKVEVASEKESVKYALSSVDATAMNSEEVAVAGPVKDVVLAEVAWNCGENAAKEVLTHVQANVIETSADEVKDMC
ncbi:unnamed protein product [Peronospora destructor]|uniref:C2H2-type domain-containing protein n=1 Tax=Peronospora destructor TaxID=86335 RepID=A0AAV0V5P8_9STRA|nr:unnamed protein product [Peronospora destructor]